jgi:hypothetical protein
MLAEQVKAERAEFEAWFWETHRTTPCIAQYDGT